MKKIKAIFILMVFSILSLTGCNAIKNAVTARTPDLNKSFSCNFSITAYDDLELSGTMSRYGSSLWEMDITAPETMAGLHISKNDMGMNISLGELEICIEQDKINNGAIAELIFKAIDDCAVQTDISLKDTENGLEYIGKASECAYVMIFDRDTMNLAHISFPALEINAEFSDFNVLSSSPSETAVTSTSE